MRQGSPRHLLYVVHIKTDLLNSAAYARDLFPAPASSPDQGWLPETAQGWFYVTTSTYNKQWHGVYIYVPMEHTKTKLYRYDVHQPHITISFHGIWIREQRRGQSAKHIQPLGILCQFATRGPCVYSESKTTTFGEWRLLPAPRTGYDCSGCSYVSRLVRLDYPEIVTSRRVLKICTS